MLLPGMTYALLQDTMPVGAEGLSTISWVVIIALIVLVIASMWRVFDKAGQPGWAAIIPIYNLVIMLKIAGRPLWWILLLVIPLVNIVAGIIVYVDMARNFGRGAGFGLGLFFLSVIFWPILAFGGARYQSGVAAPAA